MHVVPLPKLIPPNVAVEFGLTEMALPMSSIGRIWILDGPDEADGLGICVAQ